MVRHPTLTRSTLSTSSVCHPSVAASRCRVVVGFCSSYGAYDSVWDRVKPMTGKYFINYFQYQGVVGCFCMLNYWFSSNDDICPDNYNYSWFMLKGKCRSEKWEFYLCGDKTIKVDRVSVDVLPSSVPPLGFSPLLDNGSHSIFEFCLPSERVMGMSMPLAVPVSSGSLARCACPRLQLGTCRVVLHSHFGKGRHRCHCSCRFLVLCVGRLHWLCGSNVQLRCLRRHVV